MRTAAHIPGMEPGQSVRNLLLGIAYLGSLTGLVLLLPNVILYYRPFRGC